MVLTKKHFKAIAEILKIEKRAVSSYGAGARERNIEIINDLSDYFKTLNSDFDEVKFKEACLK